MPLQSNLPIACSCPNSRPSLGATVDGKPVEVKSAELNLGSVGVTMEQAADNICEAFKKYEAKISIPIIPVDGARERIVDALEWDALQKKVENTEHLFYSVLELVSKLYEEVKGLKNGSNA